MVCIFPKPVYAILPSSLPSWSKPIHYGPTKLSAAPNCGTHISTNADINWGE